MRVLVSPTIALLLLAFRVKSVSETCLRIDAGCVDVASLSVATRTGYFDVLQHG